MQKNWASLKTGCASAWKPANRYFLRLAKKRIHPIKEDKILTDWNGLMIAALRRPFIPEKVVLFRPADKNNARTISAIAPYTRSMATRDGQATAYVCQEFACKLPTTSVNQMLKNLK